MPFDPQPLDTLRIVIISGDSGIILPAREGQLGDAATWVAVLVALGGLVLAGFSARWAVRQWRLQYVTNQWANTLQFLFANPQFLNVDMNRNYRTSYEGHDLFKYELVARLSIGYVDDLYHLSKKKYLSSWLRGSVKLFVAPHVQWFRDNNDAYDSKFIEVIDEILGDCQPPPTQEIQQ